MINYNAPFSLSFALFCILVFFAGLLAANFSFDAMSFFTLHGMCSYKDISSYFYMFSYVFGHRSLDSLVTNVVYILLLGPMLEEKYGIVKFSVMVFVTVFVSGVLHVFFFDDAISGTSGVVFMMIVLVSLADNSLRSLPLTFIFIVLAFVGREVYNVVTKENISQLIHVLGGLIGVFVGYVAEHGVKKSGGAAAAPEEVAEPAESSGEE